jgi:hypothetical protein
MTTATDRITGQTVTIVRDGSMQGSTVIRDDSGAETAVATDHLIFGDDVLAAFTDEGEPRYTVQRDSYERDCENPTCAVLCRARGLHNVEYDAPRHEYADADGVLRVWSTTGHCVTRVVWGVLDAEAPGYSVESFGTRREARAEASRLNR